MLDENTLKDAETEYGKIQKKYEKMNKGIGEGLTGLQKLKKDELIPTKLTKEVQEIVDKLKKDVQKQETESQIKLTNMKN